jgi:hypothetical protein
MRVRRAFTILEIFICLSILLIAAVTIGWNIKGLYNHKQLESSAQQLVMKLHELESLAVSYQVEMEMEISHNEQGLTYRVSTDEPLKGFNQKPVLLKDNCHFKVGEKECSSLKIKVAPTGWIDKREVVEVYRSGVPRISLWIDLRVAPAIKLSREKPADATVLLPKCPET